VNRKHFLDKKPLKSYKRLAGFCFVILGIILLLFSADAAKQIARANTLSETISNFFQHNPTWNPIIKFFGGEPEKKIEYYTRVNTIIQIGAVVLTLVGVAMVVVFRNKKITNKK